MIVEANGHSIDSILLGNLLLQWGQENFREFPWRLTRDPYKILMSEVMLHRTQAIQVVPVYEQFVRQYPSVTTLANASKVELQKVLYSLGLRWRTDLIYQMADRLVKQFEGHIPAERVDLLSLPGVSDYITGAVRCFAWNLPEPLADTNTIRIVGRLFGLPVKDSSRRSRVFQGLLTSLIHTNEPRRYNYALLDLADKICRKKQPPDCIHCPLQKMCQTGIVAISSGS